MTRTAFRLAAIATLCLLALLGAGCGGDDDPTATAGIDDTLTAAEWRTRADAICTDAKSKLDALGEPTEAGIVDFLQKGLAIATERADKIAALQPPAELAATQSKAVALLRDTNAKIQSAADKITAGTPPQEAVGEADPEITKNDEELDALAKEAGLTVCGSD